MILWEACVGSVRVKHTGKDITKDAEPPPPMNRMVSAKQTRRRGLRQQARWTRQARAALQERNRILISIWVINRGT